jgi:uncharacterized protein YggE
MQAVRWTGKQVLTTIALVVLVTMVATETYALVGAGQARSISASGVQTHSGKVNGTITVSGTGHVDLQPDRAILTVGVTTTASSAQTAVQDNANTMNAVILALNGIGISNSNIQTLYYNIYPQSNYNGGTQTITGYQVTNEIQVTVVASGQSISQLGAKAGQVIDTVASKGANQIYGVQFTASASSLDQAKQTSLQQAVHDASQQAQLIASAASVTITGVVSITSVPSYYPPIYAQYFSASTASTTPIVPPQSLTVTATVQAVFSIA